MASTKKAVPKRIDHASMTLDALRHYAVRNGVKGAHKIPGGRAVLLALLGFTESATPKPAETTKAVVKKSVTPKPAETASTVRLVFNVDMSTTDKNLKMILDMLGRLPKDVLKAEIAYALEWEVFKYDGWSSLDVLRYCVRFYPHRRARLAAYPNIPVAMRDCLRRDYHHEVREAVARAG